MTIHLAVIIVGAFLVVFSGLWFLVIALVGWASGWRRIEARFPDRPNEVLATFRWASAVMGHDARFNNVLTFTACRDGLRVAKAQAFGPSDRPFFVPWGQMHVARDKVFMTPIAILSLGSPPAGTMKITGQLASQLAAAAGDRWPERAASIVS